MIKSNIIMYGKVLTIIYSAVKVIIKVNLLPTVPKRKRCLF